MVGIAEISAAIGGLKTAFGLVKGLNAAATQASINEVKIELGQHILEAQAALTAAGEAQTIAAERIRELEQEIVRLKDWSAEQKRYELKRYNPGTLAYTLKPSMAEGDPPHHLCANCYQASKKSILQATTRLEMRYRIHRCDSCKAEVPIGAESDRPPPGDTNPDNPPTRPEIDHGESSWVSARRGR